MLKNSHTQHEFLALSMYLSLFQYKSDAKIYILKQNKNFPINIFSDHSKIDEETNSGAHKFLELNECCIVLKSEVWIGHTFS